MGDCMEKGPFANKDDYLFKMMIFYLAMHEYQRLAGFAGVGRERDIYWLSHELMLTNVLDGISNIIDLGVSCR